MIDQLSYRFPEASPDSLLEILKNVNMDVNAAIQVVKSILEKESSGITQVCRHYLQGECRRADCMVCLQRVLVFVRVVNFVYSFCMIHNILRVDFGYEGIVRKVSNVYFRMVCM